MTAEDTNWANFLYETFLRVCGDLTVKLRAVVRRQ